MMNKCERDVKSLDLQACTKSRWFRTMTTSKQGHKSQTKTCVEKFLNRMVLGGYGHKDTGNRKQLNVEEVMYMQLQGRTRMEQRLGVDCLTN